MLLTLLPLPNRIGVETDHGIALSRSARRVISLGGNQFGIMLCFENTWMMRLKKSSKQV